MKNIYIIILLLACAGCGTTEDGSQVVYNEQTIIREGYNLSLSLNPGTYKLQLTSSINGVDVEWRGGTCTNDYETIVYEDSCKLTMAGQLVITNDTTWGLGPDETVSIKLIKL